MKDKDPFSRIGTVISGRNSEVVFSSCVTKISTMTDKGSRVLASRRWP